MVGDDKNINNDYDYSSDHFSKKICFNKSFHHHHDVASLLPLLHSSTAAKSDDKVGALLTAMASDHSSSTVFNVSDTEPTFASSQEGVESQRAPLSAAEAFPQ